VDGRQVEVFALPDDPLDVQELFEFLERIQGLDPDALSQA
jgi:hypothetical protein